ncbi:MAG: hypothetical protein MMC23_004816 [Stictis urceolatum]|nr:hypothetical protein [Stictis urceolata]
MSVSPQFELATLELEKVKGVVSNDDLLLCYAYFKIAHKTDFSAAKQPGTFDFTGKYKYNAWKKEVEAGLTPADAQKKYIELVEAKKKELGYDPKKTTMENGKKIEPEKQKRFEQLSKQLGKNQ